jgi:hypothetical protein
LIHHTKYSSSYTNQSNCLQEEKTPYSFFINETEILADVKKTLEELKVSQEEVLNIVYQPQAVFRVKSITRCAGSMAGTKLQTFDS